MKIFMGEGNKSKDWLKKLADLSKIFLLTIIIFVGSLVIINWIPNEYIENNLAISIEQLNEEEDNLEYFFYSNDDRAHSTTDSTVSFFEQMINNNMHSSIWNSMIEEENGSYWMGIRIIIRPLLVIMNLVQIRYLLMGICVTILAVAHLKIAEVTNKLHAVLFVVTIFLAGGTELLYDINGIGCLLLSAIGVIAVCNQIKRNGNLYKIFFVLGMVTCFFDSMTCSIMTLAFPLIITLVWIAERKESLREGFFVFIVESLLWTVGVVCTFFSKWLLSTAVCGENMFQQYWDKFAKISVAGQNKILQNIDSWLSQPSFGWRYLLIIFSIFGVIAVTFIVKYHRSLSYSLAVVPVFLCMILPILWIALMSNEVNLLYSKNQISICFAAGTNGVVALVDCKKILINRVYKEE